MIFRCWKVYSGSWRIVALPVFLFLVNISMFLMTAYCLVTAINTMTAFCRFAFRIPQRGYYLGTIILNIYATFAIIWRMPKASRLSSRARFAIGVIAESGLLYTLTSIITFCSLFSPNKTIWFSTVNEVNFHVAGLAYNFILIRVAQLEANREGIPRVPDDAALNRLYQTQSRDITSQ